MPDTAEARIGRLEQKMATLEQQLRDVAHDVDTLAPVQLSVARIEEQLKQVSKEIEGLRLAILEERRVAKEQVDTLGAELTKMRNDQASQAKANKTQLIAAAVSIITTLLLVGGTIVAAGS